MQLSGYQVFLATLDMRLFQVVNELATQDTDTRVLSSLLSEGDTFLDVGANHGSFAIVASKLVGANGFVVAVEPQPRLAKALGKSLTANALCKFQSCHNDGIKQKKSDNRSFSILAEFLGYSTIPNIDWGLVCSKFGAIKPDE